jgi:hypothetical protein
MTTNNQLWGLRPVRNEHGKIMIREVYYNSNGDITAIETSHGWPYSNDHEDNVKRLGQMYPTQEDKYDPDPINYNHTCAKWDFMTDEEFEQCQLEEQRLVEAERLAEQAEQQEDALATLNEEDVEEE